jgi:hypothetical protein
MLKTTRVRHLRTWMAIELRCQALAVIEIKLAVLEVAVLVHGSIVGLLEVLGRNKVKKQAEGVIVFHEAFENLPFVLIAHFFFAESAREFGSHVLFPYLVFANSDFLDAVFESSNKLFALLGHLEFFKQLLLGFVLLKGFDLLHGNLGLQLLNLIKSSDEIVFEVGLNVVGDHLDAVIYSVYLAHVKFVLDKVFHLFVVN